jgi:tetratricopeptide (TPR) repeat protein
MSDVDTFKFVQVASEMHTLHAKGIAHLALNEKEDAVRDLKAAVHEQAGASSIERARLLSDLSAAYIALGDGARALATTDEAWRLAQTNEIAWNRAVAAEVAKQNGLALARWREYLAREADPQWRDEAQRHVATLQP